MAAKKASASSEDKNYENSRAAAEDGAAFTSDEIAAHAAADDAVFAGDPVIPPAPQTMAEFGQRGGTIQELLEYWHEVFQWPLPIPAADHFPVEPQPDDTKAK
jgi:hypothetical protein